MKLLTMTERLFWAILWLAIGLVILTAVLNLSKGVPVVGAVSDWVTGHISL